MNGILGSSAAMGLLAVTLMLLPRLKPKPKVN
jgi:hypothetical protein